MAGPGTESTGILILRAWVEQHSTERLRVRITEVTSDQETPVVRTVSIEGACQAVRNWLETILQASDSPG